MDSPPPRPLAWVPTVLFALAAVAGLLALRIPQLLSTLHHLYDGEYAQIALLAWEMQQGTLDPDWASSIDRFVYSTTYMSYGQGTMLTSLGTVALTPLLGSSNWALQATTIVAEALSVGLVAILLARVLRFRWALLAVALWLFPPARALTWQLLPFGNHSEFLAVPVALAAFVTLRAPGDRAKWEWWVPGLLIVLGVFFYRLNLAAALAFLAVALREPGAELRKRVLVMAGAALGALLFVIDSVTGSLSSAVPKLSAAPSEFLGSSLAIFDQVPVAWNWLALPGPWLLRGLMIGLAGLCLASWGSRDSSPSVRLARFASLWALLALLLPLLSGNAVSRYWVSAYYALALCIAALLGTDLQIRTRRIVLVTALLAIAGGAVDGLRRIDPSVWEETRQVEPLSLWWELGVAAVDRDELPYYRSILEDGRGDVLIGWASQFPTGDCALHPMRGGDSTTPRQELCTGLGRGELRESLAAAQQEAREPGAPPALETVGRGLWIRCNRDMDRVRRALGLDDQLGDEVLPSDDAVEAILAGALAEAALHPSQP